MRRFAGVELSEDVVPDETTILRFRHLLEQHGLTQQIFAAVRGLLAAKRLLVQSGTIIDATIIAAPSSTKNAAQARDPEMRQTKKGNTWHFGMKLHVGTDPRGLVHSLTTTDAAQADVSQLPALVHGAERAIYGDRAYWSEGLREAFRRRGVRFRVQRRGTRKAPLSAWWQAINHTRSRIRARGGASLPRREALVGLCQGALPGAVEEHGAGLRVLRAGEPLHGAVPIGAGEDAVSPVAARAGGRRPPRCSAATAQQGRGRSPHHCSHARAPGVRPHHDLCRASLVDYLDFVEKTTTP